MIENVSLMKFWSRPKEKEIKNGCNGSVTV